MSSAIPSGLRLRPAHVGYILHTNSLRIGIYLLASVRDFQLLPAFCQKLKLTLFTVSFAS